MTGARSESSMFSYLTLRANPGAMHRRISGNEFSLKIARFIHASIEMFVLNRHGKEPHFLVSSEFLDDALQRKIGAGQRFGKIDCGFGGINCGERFGSRADHRN